MATKKKVLSKKKKVSKERPPLAKLSLKTKLYFASGLLFILISLVWNLNQTIQLTFFPPSLKATEGHSTSHPTQISIDKVGIDLPIEETAINNGAWQVAQNAVSHLTVSARPGEKGPIILYDHNTDDKFGPIRWLWKGDTIQIKTADNKMHTYKISQTMKVAPDKMDIFTQQKGESLILYTCDGFADLERFVVIALPTKEL